MVHVVLSRMEKGTRGEGVKTTTIIIVSVTFVFYELLVVRKKAYGEFYPRLELVSDSQN